MEDTTDRGGHIQVMEKDGEEHMTPKRVNRTTLFQTISDNFSMGQKNVKFEHVLSIFLDGGPKLGK